MKKIVLMVMTILLFILLSGCIFSIGDDKEKKNSNTQTTDESKKNNMGINLWYLNSWSGGYSFADVMKEARDEWYYNNQIAETDELGYPKSDASKLIFEANKNIKGEYLLIFKGKAENIRVQGVNGTVNEIYYDENSNTTTAKVNILDESTVAYLDFKGTKRTKDSELESGITDVHLYRPGYPIDGSQIFTKELVNAVKNFQVIRFMEWSSINNNPSQKWEERTLPEYCAQDRKLGNSIISKDIGKAGVAYEYMIELCNEANCDLWINIPVNADDNYIKNLAKLIRYGRKGSDGRDYPALNSNLKVYVEYGNEIWNSSGGFYGMTWIGKLLVEAQKDSSHPVVFDGDTDFYKGIYRYVGNRTVEISNIFKSEFGANQMMSRIRPVIEGQLGVTIWINYAFDFIEKYYGNVGKYIYGGGGSAYYGINMGVEDYGDSQYVINHYFDSGMYPETKWIEQIRQDAVLVRNYGLKRVAYEGGPGLDLYDSINNRGVLTNEQQREINANPKMKDMIIKCQNAWSENGGELLSYYCLGAAAPWEFTSSLLFDSNGGCYSLETPKMQAIAELKNKNRAELTFGNRIEGEIILSKTEAITRLSKINCWMNPEFGVEVLDGEDYLGLALNLKKAGKYKMVLKGRVYGDPSVESDKGISEVRLNGNLIGNINLKVNGLGGVKSALENTNEIELDIPEGLSVIRVMNKNRMTIYSLIFTEVTESTTNKKNKKILKK